MRTPIIICSAMLITFACSSVQGIKCIQCQASPSNHHCNLNGSVETCAPDQNTCFAEIRKHGGVYSIRKGCAQSLSCSVQSRQNRDSTHGLKKVLGLSRCNAGYDNSVCHYCCNYDHCNLAERPRPNVLGQSCLKFFPDCRNRWWDDSGGTILTEDGTFLGCHCDTECLQKNDCCFDYKEVCLGVLPASLKVQDPHGGATGGEYSKVLPRGGGLPVLRCFVCHEMASNEECNRQGTIERCLPNQRSCLTETRHHNGKLTISKRCSHQQSCAALQRASSCDGKGTCYSCCDLNYCNVFEKPHERNFNSSCLTAYPGYPQCKRVSLSSCSGGTRCSQRRCNCDSECSLFRDCCSDYQELCAEPETDNMAWIFEETLQDTAMGASFMRDTMQSN